MVQGLSWPDGGGSRAEPAHSRGAGERIAERGTGDPVGGAAMSATAVDYSDVQGLVRFGYRKMTQAAYVLVRVKSASAARAWLRSAPVTSAVTMNPPPPT